MYHTQTGRQFHCEYVFIMLRIIHQKTRLNLYLFHHVFFFALLLFGQPAFLFQNNGQFTYPVLLIAPWFQPSSSTMDWETGSKCSAFQHRGQRHVAILAPWTETQMHGLAFGGTRFEFQHPGQRYLLSLSSISATWTETQFIGLFSQEKHCNIWISLT